MRRTDLMQWIGWFAILFTSCETKEVKTSGFFDTKSYFESLADSLNSTKCLLEKTMITDGRQETVMDSSPDWKNELLPFIELDITKAAMASSYRADTSVLAGEIKINYLALDAYVSIRRLQIVKDSLDDITSIYAIVRSKNPYHSSADTLEFQNDTGYRISALSEPYIG
ncbi:MAG: hypothetical protein ACKOYC_03560, partial [Bacteroidota bacterium]